jgi:hypothetical protein
MPLDRRRPPKAVIARLRRYTTTLPVAPVAGAPVPRRENDALELLGTAPPVYRDALAKAYRLGCTDGRFAAPFDCDGPDLSRCTCRGRDPVEFAAYLWVGRPGPVPAGLEVNARLWYLTGLTDGAAVQACDPRHREP